MTVELLDYASGKKQVMGTVKLRSRTVYFEGAIPATIRAMLDELLAAAPSPEAFMEGLPLHISGSYLRAKAVGD